MIVQKVTHNEFDWTQADRVESNLDYHTYYTYISGGAYYLAIPDSQDMVPTDYILLRIISAPLSYFDFVEDLERSTIHEVILSYVKRQS
jgi:hypothetical protein